MTEEKTSQNRPGRKALFAGAQLPRETATIITRDSSSEFISGCTKILEEYISGNINARVEADKTDENLKLFASAINSILEKAAKGFDSEDKERIIEDLENQISSLQENKNISENIRGSADLESAAFSEFITYSTKILEDYISGNTEARIEADSEDEKIITFSIAINTILEKLKTSAESVDKDIIINDLENRISELSENIDSYEVNKLSPLLNEIESLKSEISSLKNDNEILNKNLSDTENEYNQYIQNQKKEREEIINKSVETAKLELKSEYESEIEKLRLNLKTSEESFVSFKEEIIAEEKNYETAKYSLEKCETELREIKNHLAEKESSISILQKDNKSLKESFEIKSKDLEGKIKQIEALKLRSETIVQENPMPVLLTDTSFKVLVTNKAYELMSGIKAYDIKKMNIRDFEVLEKKGDGLSNVIKNRKRSLAEIKIKLPSGIHYLKQYGIPIKNKDGDIKNILIVYNDVTKEREEAEDIKAKIKEIDTLNRRSETIVQQNPMPILLLNKNLRIIVTNRAFEEMSGIKESKLLEMNAADFKVSSQNNDGINTVFSSKKRSYSEITIELPTGTHILEQYAIPILNEREEISNILIVYNEITALRRREKEIEELMDNAREEALHLEESAEAITKNMVELAKGDLLSKAIISESDPLKTLKENFNESILSFRTLIEEISEKTNVIENTSEGLRKNNEDIAGAAEKLAHNACESSDFTRNLKEHFEKISNGISDLSASIEEISSTTQEVMRKTQLATAEGKEAAEIGKEASLKMEAVGKISKRSVEEINSLNNEMHRINDIVKLISGIAEQTNMLALNAAIEAARAGEHGRGFSVVAGEVKNLAGESKKATLEIQNMISMIQKNSENTADSMRQVDEEMRHGINSTNAAIQALNKIVQDIETASNGMIEISRATEVQAQETNSFMHSIDIANEMTTENIKRIENIAALSEEISASTQEVGSISNEMHDMSVSLKKTMDKFSI